MASGSGDEEGSTGGVSWRLIGPASELSKKRCRLMYSSLGNDCDVCLFFVKGEFFAMDARCSHSGGPLCEGDIEEADGVLQVFCPWHDYNFDLRTGRSGTSLQQQVYEVKLEDGSVYVKHRIAAFHFIVGQNPVDLNIVYLSSQTLLLRLVALERNRKSWPGYPLAALEVLKNGLLHPEAKSAGWLFTVAKGVITASKMQC